jgi:hypothetical protein
MNLIAPCFVFILCFVLVSPAKPDVLQGLLTRPSQIVG